MQHTVLSCVCAVLFTGPARAQEKPETRRRRSYVIECLDTLIEHGTDVYGPVKSPIMMAMIDVRTRTAPANAPRLDALSRLEGRLHRRGTGGSNLWYDQKLLKALYRVSKLTGYKKYETAADAYIGYAL